MRERDIRASPLLQPNGLLQCNATGDRMGGAGGEEGRLETIRYRPR